MFAADLRNANIPSLEILTFASSVPWITGRLDFGKHYLGEDIQIKKNDSQTLWIHMFNKASNLCSTERTDPPYTRKEQEVPDVISKFTVYGV